MMFNNKLPNQGKGMDGKEAQNKLVDLLSEMILNDPDIPESEKTTIRLISAAKDFEKKFHSHVVSVSESIVSDHSEENDSRARELTEYIGLMSVGFDSFVEAHNSGTV